MESTLLVVSEEDAFGEFLVCKSVESWVRRALSCSVGASTIFLICSCNEIQCTILYSHFTVDIKLHTDYRPFYHFLKILMAISFSSRYSDFSSCI